MIILAKTWRERGTVQFPIIVYIMENYRPAWCVVARRDEHFDDYREEPIIDWHRRRGLPVPA